MGIGVDRYRLDLASSVETPGQDDRQFTARQARTRLTELEGSTQTHRTRKATEASLQEMKAGVRCHWGRGLLAGDQQNVAPEQHAHGLCRDAGHVDDDFDGARRLNDVERRVVLARVGALLGRERCGQVGENLAEVVDQLARFGCWKKRELEHGTHDLMAFRSGLSAVTPGSAGVRQ